MAFSNPISWLIAGEGATGKTNLTLPANPDGNFNRPLKQLLDNDLYLKTFTDAHESALGAVQGSGGAAVSPVGNAPLIAAVGSIARGVCYCVPAVGNGANTVVVTTRTPFPALNALVGGLRDGQEFVFRTTLTNTAATTISIDALTPVPLVMPSGAALPANTIVPNVDIRVRYSSVSNSCVLVYQATDTIVTLKKQLLIVEERKALGVDAGSYTSGATIRSLTDVVYSSITGASLSGGAVSLPAGTYSVVGNMPGYQIKGFKGWLSPAGSPLTQLVTGSNAYSDANVQAQSLFNNIMTLASPTLCSLVIYGAVSNSKGMGVATSVVPYEIYSRLTIEKIG